MPITIGPDEVYLPPKPTPPKPPPPPPPKPPPKPPTKPPTMGVDPVAPKPPTLTVQEQARIEQLRKLAAAAIAKAKTTLPPAGPAPIRPGSSVVEDISRYREEEMEIRRRGAMRALAAAQKRALEEARERWLRWRDTVHGPAVDGDPSRIGRSQADVERDAMLEEATRTGNYQPIFDRIANDTLGTGGRYFDEELNEKAMLAYMADVDKAQNDFYSLYDRAADIWENGACAVSARTGNLAAWKAAKCETALDIWESDEFQAAVARAETLTGLDERGGQWEKIIEAQARADAARDAYLERAMLGVYANRDLLSAGESAINYYRRRFEEEAPQVSDGRQSGLQRTADGNYHRQTMREYVDAAFERQAAQQQALAQDATFALEQMGFRHDPRSGTWVLSVPAQGDEPAVNFAITMQDFLEWRERGSHQNPPVVMEDGVKRVRGPGRSTSPALETYVRGFAQGGANPIFVERTMQPYFERAGVEWSRFLRLRDALYESSGAGAARVEREIGLLFDEVFRGYRYTGRRKDDPRPVDESMLRRMWMESLGLEHHDGPLGALITLARQPVFNEAFGALSTLMGGVNFVLMEAMWAGIREKLGGGSPDLQFFPSPEDMQREGAVPLFYNPFNWQPIAAAQTAPDVIQRNLEIRQGFLDAAQRFAEEIERNGAGNLLSRPETPEGVSAWDDLMHWTQQASMMGWNQDLITILLSGLIDPLNYIPVARALSASSSAIWATRATRGATVQRLRAGLETFRETFPRNADAARATARLERFVVKNSDLSLDDVRGLTPEQWQNMSTAIKEGKLTARQFVETTPWYRKLFERNPESANQVLSLVEEYLSRRIKSVDPASLRTIRTVMAESQPDVVRDQKAVDVRTAGRQTRPPSLAQRWNRSFLGRALREVQDELDTIRPDAERIQRHFLRAQGELQGIDDLLKHPMTGQVPDELLEMRGALESVIRHTRRAVGAAERALDQLSANKAFMKDTTKIQSALERRARSRLERGKTMTSQIRALRVSGFRPRADAPAGEFWDVFALSLEEAMVDEFVKKYGRLPSGEVGKRLTRQYLYFSAQARVHADALESLSGVNKEIERLSRVTDVDELARRRPAVAQRMAEMRVIRDAALENLETVQRREKVLESSYQRARVMQPRGIVVGVLDSLRYGTGDQWVTHLRGDLVEANERLSTARRSHAQVARHTAAETRKAQAAGLARKKQFPELRREIDMATSRRVRELFLEEQEAWKKVVAAEQEVADIKKALDEAAETARLAPLALRLDQAQTAFKRAKHRSDRARREVREQKPKIKKALANLDNVPEAQRAARRQTIQESWARLGRRLGAARDGLRLAAKELRDAETNYNQWFEYSSAGDKSFDDLVKEAMWLDSDYVNAVRARSSLYSRLDEQMRIVLSTEAISPAARQAAWVEARQVYNEFLDYIDKYDVDGERVALGRVSRAEMEIDAWERRWGVRIGQDAHEVATFDALQHADLLARRSDSLEQEILDQQDRLVAATGTRRYARELRAYQRLMEVHDALIYESGALRDGQLAADEILADAESAAIARTLQPGYRVSPRGLSKDVANLETLRRLRAPYLRRDIVLDEVPEDPVVAGFVSRGSVPLQKIRQWRYREVNSKGYFRAMESAQTAWGERQKALEALQAALLRRGMRSHADDLKSRAAFGDTSSGIFGPAPGSKDGAPLSAAQQAARKKHLDARRSTELGALYAKVDETDAAYQKAARLFDKRRSIAEPETFLEKRVARISRMLSGYEPLRGKEVTLELLLFMWHRAPKGSWSYEEVGALWKLLQRETGMGLTLAQWDQIAHDLYSNVRAGDWISTEGFRYRSWGVNVEPVVADALRKVRNFQRRGMYRSIGSPNPSRVKDPVKPLMLMQDNDEISIAVKYLTLRDLAPEGWDIALYDQARTIYRDAYLTDKWLEGLIEDVRKVALTGDEALEYIENRVRERLDGDAREDLAAFASRAEMRGLSSADIFSAWLRLHRLGPIRLGRGTMTELMARLASDSFREMTDIAIDDHSGWRRMNLVDGVEPLFGGRPWQRGRDPDWMEGVAVEYIDSNDQFWARTDQRQGGHTVGLQRYGRLFLRENMPNQEISSVTTQQHELFHLLDQYSSGGRHAGPLRRLYEALASAPDDVQDALVALIYHPRGRGAPHRLEEITASLYGHYRSELDGFVRQDLPRRNNLGWSNPRDMFESIETLLRIGSYDPTWLISELRAALDEIGQITADDVPTTLMSPPMNNRKAATEWLEKYGMFAPKSVDEVLSGVRAWSLVDEADHYLTMWGVVPKWADENAVRAVISSPQLYYQFMRAFGYYDDPLETATVEVANFDEERLRLLAFGQGAEGGTKRAFTLEEMRWWARERFGDMVFDEATGRFIEMPWLMYQDEFRVWLRQKGATHKGLKEMGIDATLIPERELKSLSAAIERAYELQQVRLEKLFGVGSADLADDWLPQELKFRALHITSQLMQDPYWRGFFANAPIMQVLNVVGRLQRLFIAFFTAFPIANTVDAFGVKAVALSALYGPKQWIYLTTELSRRLLPDLETIGDEARTAFGLKRQSSWSVARDPFVRRSRRLRAVLSTGADLPFEMSAFAEDRLRLGFLRKMAEDAYHVFRAEGDSDLVAMSKARLVAMSFSKDLFASLEDAPTWLQALNQVIPFFSYNWRLATFTIRTLTAYPHIMVFAWQLRQAMVEDAREAWIEEHGTEAGFNPDEARWSRISFEINGTTYYFDVSSMSDYTRRLDITTEGVSLETFVRIPHPWQTALAGLFTGEETAWGAEADWHNLSPWFELLKWLEEGGMAGFDPYDRTSLDLVQWFWKMLFFKPFDREIPGRDEMLVYLALRDTDPTQAEAYLAAHPEVGLYLEHLQPHFQPGKPVKLSWFAFATDRSIARYESAIQGYEALKDKMDAYLAQWYLTPWSKEYRDAKVEARYAIAKYIEDHPILLEVWAWTDARDFMSDVDSYRADLEVEDFYSIEAPKKTDFKDLAAYRQAYVDYLERRANFLRTHPRVREYLLDGRNAVESAWLQHEAHWAEMLIRVAQHQLDAAQIEASDVHLDQSLDVIYDLISNGYRLLDMESFGAFYDAIGNEFLDSGGGLAETLRAGASRGLDRVRQLVAFPGRAEYFYQLADAQGKKEIEAREEEARYRRALDALWKRIGDDHTRFFDELNKDPWLKAHYFGIHGDTSAYGLAIAAIAKNSKDGREFYQALERNPALLAEYFRRNPDRLAAYEAGKEYFNWMQRWVQAIESGVFGLADKVWLSMPAWVRERYLTTHPDSGMHRRNVVQSVAFGSAMERWIGLLKAKKFDEAADYFDSLPDWMKERYFAKHPEQRAQHDLDQRALRASVQYFLAGTQDKQRILAANPDLAAWIARHGGDEAAWRGLIVAAYRAIPSDEPWLKRTFRERFPEVFSDEALGQRRIDKVNRSLAEHPEMRPFYEDALQIQTSAYTEQLKVNKTVPKPLTMERKKRLKKRTRRRMAAMHSRWRAEANRRRD